MDSKVFNYLSKQWCNNCNKWVLVIGEYPNIKCSKCHKENLDLTKQSPASNLLKKLKGVFRWI